jgi:hypothetical protein
MSQNSKNQGFSYYICLMIEGSGSIPLTAVPDPGGSKTRGSVGIRIQIRNTANLIEFLNLT